LKLLTDSCKLATSWLKSAFEFLLVDKQTITTDECYLLNVDKSMRILKELLAIENGACLDSGILSIALDKLEIAFSQTSNGKFSASSFNIINTTR